MCNLARYAGEPETRGGSAARLFGDWPRDNLFNSQELNPGSRDYVIREQHGEGGCDVMEWESSAAQGSGR